MLAVGLRKKSSADARELLKRSELEFEEGRRGLGLGLSRSRLALSCSPDWRKSKLVLSPFPSCRANTSETLESENAEEK